MAIQAQYQPVKLALGAFGALLTVTALSLAVCTNVCTYADNTTLSTSGEDNVTITIKTACSFSGVVPSGKEHTATIEPGRLVEDIGTTNMTAICNDPSGYDIYAVGYSNNEWKNTNLISTASTIATGTTTSGTSSWAMKLAPGTGVDAATIVNSPINFADYAAVPNDYTKVAYHNAATSAAPTTALTSTYRVYATTSQAAGSYQGQVKYTLVHPQGTDAPVAEDPGPCDDVEAEYCMQNVSEWASSLTTDSPVTAVDARDGTTYTVAKLADGNIWMLDNLALDLTNSTVLAGLSTSNTNATDTALTALRSGNRSAGDQYATAGVTNWTSGYSYSVPMVNMDSKETTVETFGDYNNGKVGGYYNYCAASAGGYCYGNGTSAGTTSGNATTSICPADWRMPTGGSGGEYNALGFAIYGGDWDESTDDESHGNLYKNALGLPLSGYFADGSTNNQGDRGCWWSSTRNRGSSMYYLNADPDRIQPKNYYTRYDGYSIRCVVDS